MAYVYILKSTRDGRYYIGSTIDVNRRLRHHQGGYTYSTRRFGKLELVFKQEYKSLKDARYIERKLKKLKRKDYIDKIIKDEYIKVNIPR
ncbi:GIY-YIG nuclease family protein [Patescibacteria group bacterium]|nr:GIY-YIG nuclease family protein [Patescibacteria group bacterium]MBU4162387.1 GIY-YIG nuclease family protein [Patescibacteria group bacterium]